METKSPPRKDDLTLYNSTILGGLIFSIGILVIIINVGIYLKCNQTLENIFGIGGYRLLGGITLVLVIHIFIDYLLKYFTKSANFSNQNFSYWENGEVKFQIHLSHIKDIKANSLPILGNVFDIGLIRICDYNNIKVTFFKKRALNTATEIDILIKKAYKTPSEKDLHIT